MQRFGTTLKEFETTAVRKVVCVAGAARVVITPIPYWMCGVDAMDLYSEKRMSSLNKQARLNVTADDSRSKRIVSAIQRIVHAGRVVLTSSQAKITRAHR